MSELRSLLKVHKLKVEINLTGKHFLRLSFKRDQFLALTSQYPDDQDINVNIAGGMLIVKNSLSAIQPRPVPNINPESITFFDL